MAQRRCLGCSVLIPTGSRCPTCRPKPAPRPDRPSAWARGYNAEYQRNRALILQGDPTCTYCGAPATTADHIVPVSLGGTNDLGNLTPACKPCNSSKGQR